ncbi:MAG: phosphopantetheine-binding protein [Prosthecobacter sp.]|nr:phosphopantetheine-binding protein [Prosthecobacter sp.]
MPDISPNAVIALIVEHQIVETDVPLTPESDLFASGLDSLAMMQLMLHLERQFGVRISPGEMTRNHFASATVLARWLSHPNRSAT